jgi:hypothetical protein
MNDQKLPVIIPYFNHTNARVNRRNLELCLKNLSSNEDSLVVLVEGIWNKEAELPDFSRKHIRHLKFDLQSPIWVKENLINLGISSLEKEWECAAWIDKDVAFTDPKWVPRTIKALKSADVLQPWSHIRFLDAVGQERDPILDSKKFTVPVPSDAIGLRSWCSLAPKDCGHAGIAWAVTRTFVEKTGGFYDRCIFGGGDRFLTSALQPDHHSLTKLIREIHGDLFDQHTKLCQGAKIGHIQGKVLHHYHGEISKRSYKSRYSLAEDHNFDPSSDVSYAENGTLKLSNPDLEQAILEYFKSRDEHLIP